MANSQIPEEVKDAILTLGKYCHERDCKDCVFAKNPEDYPHRCIFEQEHNPLWLVEDTLGEEGVKVLYGTSEGDNL